MGTINSLLNKEAYTDNYVNPKVRKEKKLNHSNFTSNLELILLGLPGIVTIFIFAYLPMFGVVIAFQNYRVDKGIFGSKFIGLKNFEFLFKSQDAWRITRNTLGLNTLFIIFGLIVSIIIALMLYELTRNVKVYQTVLFFPYFISWVVVGYMFYAFFNVEYGVINNALKFLGMSPIKWYSEAGYWPGLLTIVSVWKSMGFFSVIYYAGLMGINVEYFEAAAIDGATKFQIIKNISLPFLAPIITVMTVMQIGKIFNSDIGLFINTTRQIGELFPTTDVIDTYVFRGLTKLGDIGMTTAAALYQSIAGLILVLITNYIVKKNNEENALF